MLALIHGTVVVIAGALIAGRLRKRQFLGAAGSGPVVDPRDRALAGQVGGERNGLPEAEGAPAIPARSAPAQPAAMAVALAARTNAVAPPTTTALLVWAGLAMPWCASVAWPSWSWRQGPARPRMHPGPPAPPAPPAARPGRSAVHHQRAWQAESCSRVPCLRLPHGVLRHMRDSDLLMIY
jgi:hypothetical protein